MELEEMAINESLPAAGLKGHCLPGEETFEELSFLSSVTKIDGVELEEGGVDVVVVVVVKLGPVGGVGVPFGVAIKVVFVAIDGNISLVPEATPDGGHSQPTK